MIGLNRFMARGGVVVAAQFSEDGSVVRTLGQTTSAFCEASKQRSAR
jgi:roadblock/LC7 domain-containing protein